MKILLPVVLLLGTWASLIQAQPSNDPPDGNTSSPAASETSSVKPSVPPQTVAPIVIQPTAQVISDLQDGPRTAIQPAGTLVAELQNNFNPADTLGQLLAPDQEKTRLISLPISRVPLKNALLSRAVSLLCEESGMNYIAPSDSDFNERVTINVRMNPYELLKILEDNFAFTMEYNAGVWRFFKNNASEILTRSYTINFNNQEKVSITAPNINTGLTQAAAAASGNGGSNATPGSNSNPFSIESDRIVKELTGLLNIPTQGTGLAPMSDQPPEYAASKSGQEAPAARLVWNSTTSQLLVAGTRQQHRLVEQYLAMVDQPQKLIRIDTKFVETSRNPKSDIGIDWSGTPVAPGGGAFNIKPDALPIDLAKLSTVKLPTAVMTLPEFSLKFNAFLSDRNSNVTQAPTMLARNNQEVTFKATTETPIQQAGTQIATGTTTSTSTVVYLEVGTSMSILSQILPGGREGEEEVQLSISIITSSIVGQTLISGSPYPVLSSRTYQYSVIIPDGYTLAIAGLEERARTVNESKIPLFSSIPVLGRLFSSKSDDVTHTQLLAFITPTIERISKAAKSARPPDLPGFKHKVFNGEVNDGIGKIQESLVSFPADINALEKAAQPATRDRVLKQLDLLENELGLMNVRLKEWALRDKTTFPAEERMIADYRGAIESSRATVSKIP